MPNADLFRTLRAGDASIVTDQIDTFTETGIRLQSGQELAADIVVTATGLNILGFGGIEFVVDGAPVSLPDTIADKAMMLSGLPNYVYAIGLHQRVLDAEGRPRLRVLLPADRSR